MTMLRAVLNASVIAIAFAMPAAASEPSADGADPLAPLNRKVLAVNYVLDRAVLRPASGIYRRVVPGFARTGVRNALNNLLEPRTVLNQCLQGKLGTAAADAGRFVVNSTLGIGGLFDPATAMGLERHSEDFGQTLGRWGVGTGPYLVLPVIGPSTLRDGGAKLVDVATGPMNAVDDDAVRFGIGALDRVDKRSRQADLSGQLGDDPYVDLRELHLARRAAEVADEVEIE
ncbi:MAG: VacJ family lipoprotein [Gammaproteobacteria bacterium]|nr:VacJ family lipoprotein [Gammaproteobacteria bacterium]